MKGSLESLKTVERESDLIKKLIRETEENNDYKLRVNFYQK